MRTLILMAGLVLVAACQNEEPLTIETSGAEDISVVTEGNPLEEPRAITEPIDIVVSETAEPSLLESAALRTAGQAEERNGDDAQTVTSGEVLEVVVRVREVPEALAAWVHWLGPDGQELSEEQKPVPADGVVVFSVDTQGWNEGEYTAEIYVGGDLVDVKPFRLIPE